MSTRSRLYRLSGSSVRDNKKPPGRAGPPPAAWPDLRSAGMTRWSYHLEAMHISERWWRRKRQTEELTRLNHRLNNLGAWGWELVAYEATPMTGTFTHNIKGYAYLALFKQPQPWPGDDTSTQLEEEPSVESGHPLLSAPEWAI